MAEVALLFDDVGLAVRIQESLEAAGHSVDWRRLDADPTAAVGNAQVVLLYYHNAGEAAELVNSFRDSDTVPGLVMLGSSSEASVEAARLRVPYVESHADGGELDSAVNRGLELRFAGRISLAFARAALRVPASDCSESDRLKVVAAARNIDVGIVREALRWHVNDYVLANDEIARLRELRALKIPEVEFAGGLDGTFTVRTAVDRASVGPAEAARILWTFAAIGAVEFSPEPQRDHSAACLEIYETRRHLKARHQLLTGATHYDILEIGPHVPRGGVQAAARHLAHRFSAERLGALDLGDANALVAPVWQQILVACRDLCDDISRARHNQMIAHRTDLPEESWAQPKNTDDAEHTLARGQKALISGDVFGALSLMARAARIHPGHPVYEASLAWARYRAELSKGGDRAQLAVREHRIADQALLGRRPWGRALVALGLLTSARGDAALARHHLQEAVRVEPKLPAARALLQRLSRR